MYLADKLDEDDYREIKTNGKSESDKLEEELSFIISETKAIDIQTKLDNALNAI
ncbi:hypothetical protein QFZ37_003608 [Chryseobacterium ginsenosidimutans]|uniref:hypothetical protein n=1 Tax=Chryseobacterium ginsenosidimutans TaxID=687846 RepID=UPI002784D524|nr:hypothetical protein [Chryseobacterium ginsenosidimutans]MDQ0595239.1 hypothetical protein [Chryseobacterium ginsenosidimutans]